MRVDWSPRAAVVVGLVVLVGGFNISVLATPDWNQLPMLLAFLPFLGIALWMTLLAVHRTHRGASI